MIRAIVALYAFGLLAFPVWGLLSPDSYREELAGDFTQAATAGAAELQMAAGIHWLKNAYLAFAFLLMARYVGKPDKPADVKRAGYLLLAFPLVLVAHEGLSQLALSANQEDVALSFGLRGSMLLYFALGLCLVGIANSIPDSSGQGGTES